jgi:ribosome maturation factor RimP
MINKSIVEDLIKELIADTNLFIVEIKVSSDNSISVLIDSMDGVNLEKCILLTKAFEGKLDREIEDYELQVASAGIGQAFQVHQQYEKNIGNEVEILTTEGKKFKGTLTELTEDGFMIEYEEMEKLEGKKKKVAVGKQQTFKKDEIKYIKDIISF